MAREAKSIKANHYPHRDHRSKKQRKHTPDYLAVKAFKRRKQKLKYEDN